MNKNESYEANAVKLFVELYGWVYTYGEQILNDSHHSIEVTLRWCNLTTEVERKAKALHRACQTEVTKRAWRKALDMKVKFNDIRNGKH